jgi:hypothetical protein
VQFGVNRQPRRKTKSRIFGTTQKSSKPFRKELCFPRLSRTWDGYAFPFR